MSDSLPILYNFRRCPYAIRARIALHYSGLNCIIREVDLKNKPQELLNISSKGTVPVLQLADGTIIEESMDIIYYALNKNDPEGINNISEEVKLEINELIKTNDTEFALLLQKYKYFERYPENTQEAYRLQIEDKFLTKYDQMLGKNQFLLGKRSVADIGIITFIRQFAFVDEKWFFNSKYKNVINWLNILLNSEFFEFTIMSKYTPWKKGDQPVYFL